MARVEWSPSSLRDLDGIAEFIARDSEHYSRLMVQRVFDAAERLADHPLSGRMVPEYDCEDLREVQCGSYRVVYRVLTEVVEIVTVVHGARSLPAKPPP